MPTFKMRLMMIDHHRSVALLKLLYLLNSHALSRASQRQPHSLRCDTIVGIEKNEITILELRSS